MYVLGQQGGKESAQVSQSNVPAHAHAVNATMANAGDSRPLNNYLSIGNSYVNAAPNAQMGAAMIGSTGNGQPFAIANPYLALNYCIALYGIYPSRN